VFSGQKHLQQQLHCWRHIIAVSQSILISTYPLVGGIPKNAFGDLSILVVYREAHRAHLGSQSAVMLVSAVIKPRSCHL